ncbi:MAG: hypothetical protein WKG00_06925 [Polyangiaceae bacterium]
MVFAAVTLALSPEASAQGVKDKAALKLHDQAMNDDYLNVAFDKAEKKLKDALKQCGSGCSKETMGKLHIALGTVHGVGNGDMKLAEEDFVTALKADPAAKVDPSLTNPELDKTFAAAQKKAGGGTSKPPPGDEPGGEPKAGAGGDFEHTPITEQAINTPVPVYVEIPEDLGVDKVTLRYKPFGGTKWKSLEMSKVGSGFGGEIPCADVTTTGDIRYYIIAKDPEGNPAGTSGSLKEPHKVAIKNDIEGDPPSLPGKKPPQKCAAKEDCPPGLPGCPEAGAQRGDKGWGASCEQTPECQAGLVCLNGSCEEGTDTGGDKKPGKGPKNILSAGLQLDLMLISGAENVCSGADDAYSCFYQDGSGQFYGAPKDVNGTNGIQGGFGLAGVRALLGYDRLLLKLGPGSLAAGLRVGFAFGGSPSSDQGPQAKFEANSETQLQDYEYNQKQANAFLPLHAEVRATYILGDSLIEKKKVRPYFFLGGGVAQVNASVPVTVCDVLTQDGDKVTDGADSCDDGPPARSETVDAYQITGLNFVGVGAGAVYSFTDNVGIGAELKMMFMLPTFGVVFAPTIGPVFGF